MNSETLVMPSLSTELSRMPSRMYFPKVVSRKASKLAWSKLFVITFYRQLSISSFLDPNLITCGTSMSHVGIYE